MSVTRGYMCLDVDLPGDRVVSLQGDSVKYWVGEGLPVYEGPITGLPSAVIDELLKLQLIKPC